MAKVKKELPVIGGIQLTFQAKVVTARVLKEIMDPKQYGVLKKNGCVLKAVKEINAETNTSIEKFNERLEGVQGYYPPDELIAISWLFPWHDTEDGYVFWDNLYQMARL